MYKNKLLQKKSQMNKSFKKFIAVALSITAAITAMAGITAGAEETQNSTGINYTGKAITPDIVLYDDNIQLVKGVDYDLSYENNINVGTATIIVTFKGNYSGERRVTFNIIAKPLTQDDVSISPIENQIFTGNPITPKPTVKYGDETLEENTDYELIYADNTGAGTATITINFKGNYSGTATTNFEIIAKDLTNDDNLTNSVIPAQTYTGDPIEPKPEIKYGDKVLEEGKDYTLTYENNTNIGNATVKVEFIGDYTGETEYPFVIQVKEANADNTVISDIEAAAYTGSEIKSEPSVTVDGRTLTKDTDYTLSYENNVNVGTAIVNIEFIGNYSGTMMTDFEITPFIVTDDNVRISSISDQKYTGSEITPDITVSVIR